VAKTEVMKLLASTVCPANRDAVYGRSAAATAVPVTAISSPLVCRENQAAKRTSWVAEGRERYPKSTTRRRCVSDPFRGSEHWLEAGWPPAPPTCVVAIPAAS